MALSLAPKPSRARDRVSAEEWQMRVDLAACYRLCNLQGWEDLIFTHMSARVPGGDGRHRSPAGTAGSSQRAQSSRPSTTTCRS